MNRNVYLPLLIFAIAGCGGGSGGGGSGESEQNNEVVSSDLDSDGVDDSSDCAPEDENKWELITYKYQDRDLDGAYSLSQGELCSGEALPTGFKVDEIPSDQLDCNDEDSTVFSSIAYVATDFDFDGHQVVVSGELCTNGTIPDGYDLTITQNSSPDCDDADADTWRIVVIYQDIDGDGVGSGSGTGACIGELAPYGYSILGYDPLDNLSDPDSSSITDFDIPSSTIVVMESDADPDDV